MKKLLYVLAFAVALGLTTTSCTEENVRPANNEANGGGVLDPKG
jgi:hypothetical protein